MNKTFKDVREELGVSVKELADVCGTSQSFISEVEDGEKSFNGSSADKVVGLLLEKLNAAKIAEIFDKQGSITILKVKQKPKKDEWGGGFVSGPGYIARVEFRTKDKTMTEMLRQFFGVGSIAHNKYGKDKKSNVYTYMAWSANAEAVLKKIHPYLTNKKHKAECIFKLREMQKANRRTARNGVSPEYLAEAEALFGAVRS
jgi:DNA-binding XRE family transcriptional regulator